jgi:hypothetical protein
MPFAACLFGTQTRRCAGNARAFADVLFAKRPSEVGDEGLAGFVDQDVARLDVAMGQPLLVGVVQRQGNRRDNLQCLLQARRESFRRLVRSVPSMYFDTTKQGNSVVLPTS